MPTLCPDCGRPIEPGTRLEGAPGTACLHTSSDAGKAEADRRRAEAVKAYDERLWIEAARINRLKAEAKR
jgi:hypothetical protein